MDINELMEKRRGLLVKMRALHEKAAGEKRTLLAEEQSQYKSMETDVRELAAQIEAEKRNRELAGFESSLPPGEETEIRATDEKQLAEFRHFLATGEQRDLAVGTNAGALAPQLYVAELIKDIAKSTPILSMVRNFQLNGVASMGTPEEENDAADAAWTQEVPSDITADSSLSYKKREITPVPLVKLIKVSRKLLKTSAFPVESIIREKLVEKISAACEKAILTGTGTDQPLGIFTANNKGVPTNRDVAGTNTATVLSSDSFIETKMKVRPAYRSNATWILSTDVMLEALKLKDKNGQYMWRPGLVASEPDTLLNRPVLESEYAPSVIAANAYVAVFGDMKYYWWATVGQMEIQVLLEKYAETLQNGYLGTFFADGEPVLAAAFSRMKMGAA